MRRRECELGESTRDEVTHRMTHALEIMRTSAMTPLKTPVKSMGGLIGGEAKKLAQHDAKGRSICGDVLHRAAQYAMAVLEVNASMGLIVAAPTAGSAGVLPGMLFALQDCYKVSDERLLDALFNAGAIGYLAMRNATVAGAVGGCQAEIGVASAMAASAAVELMGGSPEQCLDAASTVLMNMLGLVCDPVGGLVEYPCQNRNAAGVANSPVSARSSRSTKCSTPCTLSAAAFLSSCARPLSAAAPPPRPPAKNAGCAHKQDHIRYTLYTAEGRPLTYSSGTAFCDYVRFRDSLKGAPCSGAPFRLFTCRTRCGLPYI